MKRLNRDAILKADDLRVEEVEVPEWGGVVALRELKGSERDSFEADSLDENQKVSMKNVRARLIALSAVDDKGERIFSQKDAIKLGSKSATALNRLFEVACRLSGITEADVEELEKN
jgi:hypothetical protein